MFENTQAGDLNRHIAASKATAEHSLQLQKGDTLVIDERITLRLDPDMATIFANLLVCNLTPDVPVDLRLSRADDHETQI